MPSSAVYPACKYGRACVTLQTPRVSFPGVLVVYVCVRHKQTNEQTNKQNKTKQNKLKHDIRKRGAVENAQREASRSYRLSSAHTTGVRY